MGKPLKRKNNPNGMNGNGREKSELEKGQTNQAVIRQSKSRIRHRIEENNLGYHWTLTYRNEIEDRKQALNDFKKFMMRLNYFMQNKAKPEIRKTENIRYVAVLEVQQGRKKRTGKSVIHFHVATDTHVSEYRLKKLWKHGSQVKVTGSGKQDNAQQFAGYLSKYLAKDMELDLLPRKKNEAYYLCSKGLDHPKKTSEWKEVNELRFRIIELLDLIEERQMNEYYKVIGFLDEKGDQGVWIKELAVRGENISSHGTEKEPNDLLVG